MRLKLPDPHTENSIHVLEGFDYTGDYILPDPSKFAGSVLAPWLNRIDDGRYTFNNTVYHLPINEMARNNALHGLVYNQPFQLVHLFEEAEQCGVVLSYTHMPTEGYPWVFTLLMTYVLDKDNKLHVRFEATTELEETFPFTIGFHPYFNFSEPTTDTCTLVVPQVEREICFNDKMIPVGNTTDLSHPELACGLQLKGTSLDSCWKMKPGASKTLLKDGKRAIVIEQSAEFSHVQVYTPGHRASVAIGE